LSKLNLRLFFSLLLSFFLACYVQCRVFFDPTAINNDVRNQIYWMARLVDPTLFPKDFIASYFSQDCLISPVVKAIYAIAVHWFSPLQVSQFLPFILVVLSTFFLFKLAELYAGHCYAFWVSFAFNFYIWVIRNLSGGLPRAFFYPLFFLFLWLLTSKRYGWIIFCLCLEVLIYPPVFFLSLLLLFVELLFDIKKRLVQPQQIFYIFLGVISSSLTLVYRYAIIPKYNFGSLTTIKEALYMPEFYADGRIKIFPLSCKLSNDEITLIDIFHLFDRFLILIISTIVIFILIVIVYKKFLNPRYGSILIPRYIWSLTVCSLVLYILAFPCMFYLYVPDRYIYYSLPLVVVFLAGSIFYKLESLLKNKRYISWVVALFILLIISPYWKEDLININPKERTIYNYLKSVPKSAVIAAPIQIADNIPAFSYKTVLTSYESNIPFHKKYYKEIKSRIDDWNNAYYSENLNEVKSFIKKYKVDYIIIDKSDFKNKTSLVLNKVFNICKVFRAGNYVIISTKKLQRISENYILRH